MKVGRLFTAILLTILLSACSTPKNFNYLQDLTNGQVMTTTVDGTIRLQPKDQISIIVKSKDPLMSNLFNKGISTSMKSGQTEGNVYMTGYTLSPNGDIDFPVLGRIRVAGLTKKEVEAYLRGRLSAYLKEEPLVNVLPLVATSMEWK